MYLLNSLGKREFTSTATRRRVLLLITLSHTGRILLINVASVSPAADEEGRFNILTESGRTFELRLCSVPDGERAQTVNEWVDALTSAIQAHISCFCLSVFLAPSITVTTEVPPIVMQEPEILVQRGMSVKDTDAAAAAFQKALEQDPEALDAFAKEQVAGWGPVVLAH